MEGKDGTKRAGGGYERRSQSRPVEMYSYTCVDHEPDRHANACGLETPVQRDMKSMC